MLLILKRWIKGPWLVHDIIHDIYQESLIEMKRTISIGTEHYLIFCKFILKPFVFLTKSKIKAAF